MRTGNESLVSLLPECGLRISYEHVRRLSAALINSVIILWEHIVEVVPGQAIREKSAKRVIYNINYDPCQQQQHRILCCTVLASVSYSTLHMIRTIPEYL